MTSLEQKRKFSKLSVISLVLVIGLPVSLYFFTVISERIWWFLIDIHSSNALLNFAGKLDMLFALFIIFAGFFLAIVAIIQITLSRFQLKGIDVAISAILIFILMLGACMNFLDFTAKSKQSEARRNLEEIFQMQNKYHKKYDHYAATFKELNWPQEERIPKYTYCLSSEDYILGIRVKDVSWQCLDIPENNSYVSEHSFRVAAVANIDSDEILDVWTIDEKGKLTNVIDDAECDTQADLERFKKSKSFLSRYKNKFIRHGRDFTQGFKEKRKFN